MESGPLAIVVRELIKIYPNQSAQNPALNRVSFDIEIGKVACLLGPNGSGKTTLLKILAGLMTPTSGEISMLDLNPADEPHKVRNHLGWMPAEERSGFYGRLTGKQNLVFFATLHNVPPKKMERVVGNLAVLLDMNEELDKKILFQSGGGRQKLGLARSLIHDPSILLLDEPFRNLDPHSVVRFRHLLSDHITRVQKRTVLLSTHQLEEAYRISDIVMFMNKGKIVRIMNKRELSKELEKTSGEDFYIELINQSS